VNAASGCIHEATVRGSRLAYNPGNAERDIHNLFNRFGMALKVPITHYSSTLYSSEGVKTPMLMVTDMLSMLLNSYSAALLGGLTIDDVDLPCFLRSFWNAYRHVHPEHAVFQQHGDHLDRVLPIEIHGDSGTSHKKRPIEVVNIQTLFGRWKGPSDSMYDTDNKRRKLHPDITNIMPSLKRKIDECGNAGRSTKPKFDQVRPNIHGNSLSTRFLVFALPRLIIKQYPLILMELFAKISDDLRNLFMTGLVVGGKTFYIATLGMKGDMEWHSKNGNMTRDWNHLGVNCGICHLCLAGFNGHDFHNSSFPPLWVNSLFTVKPWTSEPPFVVIPFDQSGRLELFFRHDPFHVIKVGIGRNWCAGAIWLLCLLSYFPGDGGDSVAVKLQRAWHSCAFWCRMNGKTLWLRGFTKENFHQPKITTYGFVGCKGSDTMILMRWISWYVRLNMTHLHDDSHKPLFEAIAAGCDAIVKCFRVLYAQPLWMKPEFAKLALGEGTVFLKAYSFLADQCYHLGYPCFGMVPKFHAWHHILYDIYTQLSNECPLILNPLYALCEMDEDFVGHVALSSRGVSSRTCSLRVLQRYLVTAKSQLKRFKD
jgi:hypothetical protein